MSSIVTAKQTLTAGSGYDGVLIGSRLRPLRSRSSHSSARSIADIGAYSRRASSSRSWPPGFAGAGGVEPRAAATPVALGVSGAGAASPSAACASPASARWTVGAESSRTRETSGTSVVIAGAATGAVGIGGRDRTGIPTDGVGVTDSENIRCKGSERTAIGAGPSDAVRCTWGVGARGGAGAEVAGSVTAGVGAGRLPVKVAALRWTAGGCGCGCGRVAVGTAGAVGIGPGTTAGSGRQVRSVALASSAAGSSTTARWTGAGCSTGGIVAADGPAALAWTSIGGAGTRRVVTRGGAAIGGQCRVGAGSAASRLTTGWSVAVVVRCTGR